MTLIDFNSYKNSQSVLNGDDFSDLDDVKLLALRFLECNSQHVCGVMCATAAQPLYDGFIVDFLADMPEMSLSERGAFINETIATITAMREGKIKLPGLSFLNAHVLLRLIDRLQMELPPTPAYTTRLLRMVTTRHGTAHKVDEFILFSRSARYSAAFWAAMAAEATKKGGHSLAIANELMQAVNSLVGDMPVNVELSATA